MAVIPDPRDQWYVIQVLAGQESRVKESITRRSETEEMGDYIFEVLVPTERVAEVKRGRRTEINRKFFPGYVIANMWLLDENNKLVDKTWYFVKDTPGVINFAGNKEKPIPLRKREVESMLAQFRDNVEAVRPKVVFDVGDTVRVIDGPFDSFTGIVEEVDPERGKLRVSVSIFGRATPVDLEYWQVERA